MKKGKKQEVKSFTDNWIEELRPAMMTIDKDNGSKANYYKMVLKYKRYKRSRKMSNNIRNDSMMEALNKDGLEALKQDLRFYFSECYNFGPNQRISEVEIKEGIVTTQIVIELRNNKTGDISYQKVPYEKAIKEMEELQKKRRKFYISALKLENNYKERILARCKEMEKEYNVKVDAKADKIVEETITLINSDSMSSRQELEDLAYNALNELNKIKNQASEEGKKLENLGSSLDELSKELSEVYPSKERVIISDQRYQKMNQLIEQIKKEAKESGLLDRYVEYLEPEFRSLLSTPIEELSFPAREYLLVAEEFLAKIMKANEEKMETDTFRTLPIEEKLKLAYYSGVNTYLFLSQFSRIIGSSFQGQNTTKFFSERETSKRKELAGIAEKIDAKETITPREMWNYISSFQDYEVSDVEAKILEEAPSIIDQLKRLKEQFPEEKTIDKKLSLYTEYLSIAQEIEKRNSKEARLDYFLSYTRHLLEIQKEQASTFLKGKNYNPEKDNEYEIKRKAISIFIEYVKEQPENTPQYNTQIKEERLEYLLKSGDLLNEGISICDSLDSRIKAANDQNDHMQSFWLKIMIDRYKDAYQFQKKVEDFPEIYEIDCYVGEEPVFDDIMNCMKQQCETLESWAPTTMQEISEDRLNIPAELLLEKGIKIKRKGGNNEAK